MVQDSDIPTIELKVPTGWEQWDEQPLRYVFGLLAQGFPSPQIKTCCLFRWSGMQVMYMYGRGSRKPGKMRKISKRIHIFLWCFQDLYLILH